MTYATVTGYPFDMREDESEDDYVDRMITEADDTPACERTVAGGTCTQCERRSPELLPWSGERVCWDCFDRQLDLMAIAIREAGLADHLVFGADVPEPFELVEA